MSQDHAKLRYVFDLIKPRLVFVQNGEIYARALAALDLQGVLLVHVDKAPPQMQSLPWGELLATRPTGAVARSVEAIEPGTIGKFLFTSGSTGMPKAVINTQEMMCANLAMGQMARTRRPDDPPAVMLDWLPWNHTMGGNATFQGNLADGGTTYIDDGKPLPGLFEETLRNLREVSPLHDLRAYRRGGRSCRLYLSRGLLIVPSRLGALRSLTLTCSSEYVAPATDPLQRADRLVSVQMTWSFLLASWLNSSACLTL